MLATVTTTHSAAEPARAQLRSNLAAYFRGQPVAEGHQTWGGASQLETPQQNKLLVGDPVTLMVSPPSSRISFSIRH